WCRTTPETLDFTLISTSGSMVPIARARSTSSMRFTSTDATSFVDPSESRSKTALPIRPAPTTAPSTSLMCRFIPGSVVSEFSGEKGVRGSVRWIHIVNDAGRTLPAGWWFHGGRRPSPSAPGLRAQGLGGRPPLLPRGSGLGAWGLGAAAAPPPPRGVGLGAQGLGAPSPYSLSPTPYALRPKPSAHKLHHNPRMSRDRIVWAGLVVALCAGCRGEPEEIAVRAPSSQTFHQDRKSTRLNSSHVKISYAVFCLKKKK